MNASTPETLRDAIIDVVLTQIDPSVIDAQTAIDFGSTTAICNSFV